MSTAYRSFCRRPSGPHSWRLRSSMSSSLARSFSLIFFNYEELNPPDRYPSVIPAPANVLKWQAGDCFDLSIAVCSLLLGVGYDAYCVSGFAPRFITTRNETRSMAPHLERESESPEQQEKDVSDEDNFTIPKKPPLRSEYQAQQAAAQLEQEA